ncbi:hypothetical protein H696_06277, partial [Fonticula alba]
MGAVLEAVPIDVIIIVGNIEMVGHLMNHGLGHEGHRGGDNLGQADGGILTHGIGEGNADNAVGPAVGEVQGGNAVNGGGGGNGVNGVADPAHIIQVEAGIDRGSPGGDDLNVGRGLDVHRVVEALLRTTSKEDTGTIVHVQDVGGDLVHILAEGVVSVAIDQEVQRDDRHIGGLGVGVIGGDGARGDRAGGHAATGLGQVGHGNGDLAGADLLRLAGSLEMTIEQLAHNIQRHGGMALADLVHQALASLLGQVGGDGLQGQLQGPTAEIALGLARGNVSRAVADRGGGGHGGGGGG